MIRFHGSCTQGSWHGGTGSSTDSLGAEQVLQIRYLAVRGTRRKRGKKLPQLVPICKTGSQEEIPVCHTCCHLVNVAHCWLSHSIFGLLNVLMFLRWNHNLAKTDVKIINLRMPFARLFGKTVFLRGVIRELITSQKGWFPEHNTGDSMSWVWLNL